MLKSKTLYPGLPQKFLLIIWLFFFFVFLLIMDHVGSRRVVPLRKSLFITFPAILTMFGGKVAYGLDEMLAECG
jgi:hypothetical protein